MASLIALLSSAIGSAVEVSLGAARPGATDEIQKNESEGSDHESQIDRSEEVALRFN